MKSRVNSFATIVILALFVSSLVSVPSHAATATWTGGGTNSSFSAALNWGGTAPVAATTTDYTFSGSVNTSPNIDAAVSYSISSINFDSTAGAFTIGSNGSLYSNRFTAAGSFAITQNSGNNQVINATIFDGTSATITISGTGAGTLTLNSLRFAQNCSYIVNMQHSVILGQSSWVGDSTGTTGNITINDNVSGGSSKLTFSGTSYQGLSAINLGVKGATSTFEATNAGGFTTTASLSAVQNVTFTGNGAITISGRFIELGNADKTNTFNTSTTLGSSGNTIQLGAEGGTASRTVTFSSASGVTTVLAGKVTGTSSTGTTSLVASGAGVLILSGGANYKGTTTVSGGTLLINGDNSDATGATIVQSGATLGGTGTIGGTTTVSGNLNPGAIGSAGTLTISGNVNMMSGSSASFDVNGTAAGAFDKLDTLGVLGLNGNLTLNIGYTVSTGSTWDLFDSASYTGDWSAVSLAGSYTGTFTSLGGGEWSLTAGDGSKWLLNDSTGILSVVVPEPSVVAMLALGLGGVCLLIRRRKTDLNFNV
jgi:autotransporter-associated beta strand protein